MNNTNDSATPPTGRVYRLSMRDKTGEHKGYQFFRTRQQARDFRAEHGGTRKDQEAWFCIPASPIDDFNINLTDAGVLAALNSLASHADNG